MGLSTIVVGIDRSPTAAGALQWAVNLGEELDAKVTAVSSWQMPFIASFPDLIDGLPTAESMSTQCAEALDRVVTDVGSGAGIGQLVVEGKPGPALIEAASDADLLVVGRTGQGKRHGLARIAEVVLGSTARHSVHHSRVPVVAVPDGAVWDSPATVVVGVDGSKCSLAALDWALVNLPAGATLHVVRAFAPWVGDGLTPADLVMDADVHDSFRDETQQWVDAAIKRVGTAAGPAPVVEVAIGNARDVLADPGYPMDLLVVGERGHTGVVGMVLGSVSDHLVRYANCPVVVIPDVCE